MSVKVSTWAWSLPLKGNEKLVLLALADHANDEGRCWPSIESLVEKCGLSRSPIIEHLKKLHQLGLFTKETLYDQFGKKKGNVYTLNISLSPELLRSKLLRPDLLRSENTSTKSGFTPDYVRNPDLLLYEESSMNHQEPSNILSGKPDIAHLQGEIFPETEKPPEPPPKNSAKRKKTELKQQALEILSFLNRKADTNFEAVKANLDLISARLQEGATISDCKMVIAAKVRQWLGDPQWEMYLRPATLFNRTKFAQYKGKLPKDDDDE